MFLLKNSRYDFSPFTPTPKEGKEKNLNVSTNHRFFVKNRQIF